LVGHLQDLDLDAILILKLDLQTSEKMAWTELLRHMIGITFGLLWTRWWALWKTAWHPQSVPCPVHMARNTKCIAAMVTWHRKARGPAHLPFIISRPKAPVEMTSTRSMYNMLLYNMLLYKSVRSTILTDNAQHVTRGLDLIFSLWLITSLHAKCQGCLSDCNHSCGVSVGLSRQVTLPFPHSHVAWATTWCFMFPVATEQHMCWDNVCKSGMVFRLEDRLVVLAI
jgi:hypothetical protein